VQVGAAVTAGQVVVGPAADGTVYTQPSGTEQKVSAILLGPGSTTLPSASDTKDPTGTYILPVDPAVALATTPDSAQGDKQVEVIVATANGVCSTNASGKIYVGPNLVTDTYVWGPLRACQHTTDQSVSVNVVQKPSATLADGINGDVAWSPQFCFRSRFYQIYVLGRGLVRTFRPKDGVSTEFLNVTGTRRLEAVYDAWADKVLWEREQVSEKRALGDP
jgi:hypothetical protein